MIAMDREPPVVQPEIVTEEIPRGRWDVFTHDLSKDLAGWRVWIELLGESMGDQPLLDGLQLQGVSFETAGSARGSLLIEAGDREGLFIHQVERPVALRVAHLIPGGLMFMQIVSADGSVTLLRFERALELPEGRPARPQGHAGTAGAHEWARGSAAEVHGWGREPVGGGDDRRPVRHVRRRAGDGLLLALLGVGALLLFTRGTRRQRGPRGY
jgi:hypothetical protein